jgi:hypothetical protein
MYKKLKGSICVYCAQLTLSAAAATPKAVYEKEKLHVQIAVCVVFPSAFNDGEEKNPLS